MEVDYNELQELGFYGYVAKHYWEMSKEQLCSFVKELSYSAENQCISEHGMASGRNIYKNCVEMDAINELIEQEV